MKAKKLIEILQTVKPDSEVYFTDFMSKSKKYRIEFVEKTDSVYFKGYNGASSLSIMFVDDVKNR